VLDSGESRKEVIRPDFNRAIMIDFQGATISSDVGFLLVREIDERFRIIGPMGDCLEDLRSPAHTKHALVQMVRQRVYQIAAGYEVTYMPIVDVEALRSRRRCRRKLRISCSPISSGDLM
jgi:hypothetical protein